MDKVRPSCLLSIIISQSHRCPVIRLSLLVGARIQQPLRQFLAQMFNMHRSAELFQPFLSGVK